MCAMRCSLEARAKIKRLGKFQSNDAHQVRAMLCRDLRLRWVALGPGLYCATHLDDMKGFRRSVVVFSTACRRPAKARPMTVSGSTAVTVNGDIRAWRERDENYGLQLNDTSFCSENSAPTSKFGND